MIVLADPDVTVHLGDVRQVLAELEPESVDCVITSPPYADARRDYRNVPLGDYHAWSALWLHLAHVVTAPHGALILNLGRIFRNGEEHDYQHDVLRAARTVGWRRLDTLVWSKPNANPIHGVVLADSHEYVYILGREQALLYPDAIRTPYADVSKARMARRWINGKGVKNDGTGRAIQLGRDVNPLGARPRSVVTIAVGRDKGNPHPAPMPAELAEHLVALACPPAGTVLDPFAGSGTTGVAARKLGRSAILIDESEDYCRLIATRLQQLSLLAEGAA